MNVFQNELHEPTKGIVMKYFEDSSDATEVFLGYFFIHYANISTY